jgi:alkylation response protein AidB-like acyl-CoA dehydrogenase
VIRREKSSCLGITEPDAGSDVAGIRTHARQDGDDYVINGSKTFITNGHRADFIVLVTKTDPDAGYDGFTLFLVDMHARGVTREKRLENARHARRRRGGRR